MPEDVRDIIGKKEIIRSLQTSDYNDALLKHRIQMFKVEDQIIAARRKLKQQEAAQATSEGAPPIQSLSIEEIQSIVLTWFHELELGNAPSIQRERGDYEAEDAIEDALLGDLGALGDPFEGDRWVEAQTDALLEKNSIDIPKSSPEYHTIKTFVKRGLSENYTRRLNDIGRGRYEADFYFREIEHVSPLPDAVKRNAPRAKLTFGGVLEKYLAEKKVAPKTRDQYEQHSRRFIEFVGAGTPVEQIDRDAIVAYRDLLKKIPSNAAKLFKGKTFQQIADSPRAAKYAPLHPRSINKVLETLSSLFRFAEEWGFIARNPAKGLQLEIDTAGDPNRRRPYTIEELQRIFDAPLYRGCMNDESGFARSGTQVIRRHRFWIPLIALYTGMRLNEICQLYLEDVKEENGVAYIDIRERRADGSIAPDKSLKNKAARRKVPIHPELQRIGLLDYAASLEAQSEERLFRALPYAKSGGYFDAFQKWYSRFLGTAGRKDDKSNGRLVFHSFRHTFRDRLREAEVFSEYVHRLGGWTESNSTAADYGEGVSVAKLSEQIDKVSYPDLILKHLWT